MSFLLKWVFLSVFLFVGINWLLRPMFGSVGGHSIPALTYFMAGGLSGCIMIGVLLFGKGK